METIEATEGDKETIAAVHLLKMVIKSVPEGILRNMFSKTATALLDILKRYVDDSSNEKVFGAVIPKV